MSFKAIKSSLSGYSTKANYTNLEIGTKLIRKEYINNYIAAGTYGIIKNIYQAGLEYNPEYATIFVLWDGETQLYPYAKDKELIFEII